MSSLSRQPSVPIVLASASRARARMLEAAGIPVQAMPVGIDEVSIKEAMRAEGAEAEATALMLADLKGQAAAARVSEGAIVIAADQMLVVDGVWLDKAASMAEAGDQLERLAGRQHQLISAVVGFRGGGRIWQHVGRARLWMRPMERPFIDAYLAAAGEAVLSSVGCYELEGLGAQLMSRVEGDHFTVLGMPLLAVLQFLRDQRVIPA